MKSNEIGSFRDIDTPKPTAWIRDDGVIAFHPKAEIDSQGFKWFPLYMQPQNYCPSENNASYEKGVIDGMSRMTESAVHRAVEALASDDVKRYQWLRNEFSHGRETYIGESMPSGESLDKYIDEQLKKAQEK